MNENEQLETFWLNAKPITPKHMAVSIATAQAMIDQKLIREDFLEWASERNMIHGGMIWLHSE